MDHTRIYVDWVCRDQRALDVCLFSIQRHASDLVEIVPLKPKAVAALCGPDPDPERAKQARARFLVPALNGFAGWAVFVSSDMLFQADICDLWRLKDDRYAVMGVPADPLDGTALLPRSSLLLWNCGHPANRALTAERVAATDAKRLARYEWHDRAQIGELPSAWCWREGLSDPDLEPKAIEFAPKKPWADGAEICRYADRWLGEAERIFGTPSRGAMSQGALA